MSDRRIFLPSTVRPMAAATALTPATIVQQTAACCCIGAGLARDTSTDFEFPRVIDGLRHLVRGKLWRPLAGESVTISHNPIKTALPYRHYYFNRARKQSRGDGVLLNLRIKY